MARKKNVATVLQTKFHRESSVEVGGFIINAGDIIKIQGEYGVKFKFNALVTNTETGVKWVDCLQLDRGVACGWRSFYPDRIKRIPIRGKRAKRVN
jgi:hypothetical protein